MPSKVNSPTVRVAIYARYSSETKRGQLGRALKGKIPGGKAYGYDVLPAAPPARRS